MRSGSRCEIAIDVVEPALPSNGGSTRAGGAPPSSKSSMSWVGVAAEFLAHAFPLVFEDAAHLVSFVVGRASSAFCRRRSSPPDRVSRDAGAGRRCPGRWKPGGALATVSARRRPALGRSASSSRSSVFDSASRPYGVSGCVRVLGSVQRAVTVSSSSCSRAAPGP